MRVGENKTIQTSKKIELTVLAQRKEGTYGFGADKFDHENSSPTNPWPGS